MLTCVKVHPQNAFFSTNLSRLCLQQLDVDSEVHSSLLLNEVCQVQFNFREHFILRPPETAQAAAHKEGFRLLPPTVNAVLFHTELLPLQHSCQWFRQLGSLFL